MAVSRSVTRSDTAPSAVDVNDFITPTNGNVKHIHLRFREGSPILEFIRSQRVGEGEPLNSVVYRMLRLMNFWNKQSRHDKRMRDFLLYAYRKAKENGILD